MSSDAPLEGPRLSADRRLGPWLVGAVAGLVGALVGGHAVVAAFSVPFLWLLGRGWSGRPPEVVVDLAPGEARIRRVLEGDEAAVRVAVHWAGPGEIELAVSRAGGQAAPLLARVEGGASVAWRGDGSARGDDGWVVTIPLETTLLGRRSGLSLEVVVRRPHGLLRSHQRIDLDATVVVLPRIGRAESIESARQLRAAAGVHPARARGGGTDFAELRPYVPGDRLRDLAWAATARSGQPWVVDHHPERIGTVVFLLDTFLPDATPPAVRDRIAAAVWALAQAHLATGDRVAVAATGTATVWLPPVAGRRARWKVLDALYAATTTDGGGTRRRLLPADTVVVGITPLASDGFLAELVHHRRQGRPTIAVVVDVEAGLAPVHDPVERAARRLWRIDVDERRTALARAGIPTAPLTGDITAAATRMRHVGRPTLARSR